LDVPPTMKVKGYMYPQMKKPVGYIMFLSLTNVKISNKDFNLEKQSSPLKLPNESKASLEGPL
jgi:hypothetical protein